MTDTYFAENISDIILRISYAKSSQGQSAFTIIEYFNTATVDQIVEDYFNDLIVENKVSDDYILEQTNIVFEGIGSAIASRLGFGIFKKLLPRRIAGRLTAKEVVKRALPAAALTAGTIAILKPDLAKKAVEKTTGTVTRTADNVKTTLSNLIPDIKPKDGEKKGEKEGEKPTTTTVSGMSPLSKPEPESISQRQIEREYKYNKMKQRELARNSMEAYDIVLDYVMAGGHADTLEEAHYIMMEMTSETIQNIIEGVMPEPIDPTAHKEAQRLARQQGKVRALEAGATTPGEQKAAQSKLRGPQLPGV